MPSIRRPAGQTPPDRQTPGVAAVIRLRHLAIPGLCCTAALIASCGPGRQEGPVNVALIGEAPALADPNAGRLPFGARVLLGAVAQGLVRYDASGQIQPALADRWLVTEDGLGYIFRLREAQWPDGTPITARDIQRALNTAVATRSDNALKATLEAIADILVVTPEVIEIRLNTPRPPLLDLLAQPEFAVARMPLGGAGPFRIADPSDRPVRLVPAEARDPDDTDPVPETQSRIVTSERAAAAVARFMAAEAALVLGGTLADLPIARAAEPPANQLRFDPAQGLLALQLVAAEGVLADPANRRAVAMAIDRGRIARTFAVPGWEITDTVMPESFRSSAPPAAPVWSAAAPDARRAEATARIAAWIAEAGAPATVRIAMPEAPGMTVLYALIASDLAAVGVTPVRTRPGEPADLRLVDAVAPAGSAIWYLSTLGCPRDGYCEPIVAEALAAARNALTLDQRGTALAVADRALADSGSLIPIARPVRWSLAATRLRGFTPNARAVHPLDQLLPDR